MTSFPQDSTNSRAHTPQEGQYNDGKKWSRRKLFKPALLHKRNAHHIAQGHSVAQQVIPPSFMGDTSQFGWSPSACKLLPLWSCAEPRAHTHARPQPSAYPHALLSPAILLPPLLPGVPSYRHPQQSTLWWGIPERNLHCNSGIVLNQWMGCTFPLLLKVATSPMQLLEHLK